MATEKAGPQLVAEAPVEKFPQLRPILAQLKEQKAAIHAKAAPLRAQREKVQEQMRPLEAQVEKLTEQIRAIEHGGEVTIGDLDNQIAALERTFGARSMSKAPVPEA